jgi:hypothetical protein
MSWPEVLQALERSLWEAELVLDGDFWDQPASSWAPPLVPLPHPSAAEAVRLQELSSRCELLRRRLEGAMGDISAQLDGTRRLREGAYGYLMTQNLTPSGAASTHWE